MQFPGIITRIRTHKIVQHRTTIPVEILFQHPASCVCPREVEKKHLIFSLQRSRMASDPQLPEAFLELILLRQVVIRTQHAQEDTFSETARTDEKQAIRLILQQGQVHRLIYIILVRSTTSTKLETPYGILFAFSIALPFYRMIIQITNIRLFNGFRLIIVWGK